MILAIDPGRDKCGIAQLTKDAHPLAKKVVPRRQLLPAIADILAKNDIFLIILGESAHGRQIEKELRGLNLKIAIVFAAETNSTLLARQRYWQDNPPRGLRRLLPLSLQLPPVPVDDYAAVILGERYLRG
jgi:RNase H-fold protein (predicted Holliday junction resolvase)